MSCPAITSNRASMAPCHTPRFFLAWKAGLFALFLFLLRLTLLTQANCHLCCHGCMSHSDPPKETVSGVSQ